MREEIVSNGKTGEQPDQQTRKALKWGKILLVTLIVLTIICLIVIFCFPREIVDTYLDLISELVVIKIDGKEHGCRFKSLEQGVSVEDRRFLSKKIVAFRLMAERNREIKQILNEYLRMFVKSAEDEHLSKQELDLLLGYKSDLIDREKLENLLGYMLLHYLDAGGHQEGFDNLK